MATFLLPGSRLGPFVILAPLGEGGMGQVYRARDERLGREVALKLLPDAFREDPERSGRLLLEAKAAGRLDHPNILAVHDVGTHEGRTYMVTELLEGRSLRDLMPDGEPLPARKAVGLALQLAQGLAAAHEKGIVHRDIKPENLFVTQDGRLKILDFGLAKTTPSALTEPVDPTDTMATAEGVVMGTVGYMAPEQVRAGAVDHRTDLFAFGVVLFEMLSGHRPFLGHTTQEVLFAILKRSPPDLLEAQPQLGQPLAQLVERCLEKDPALRYQSTRDLAHALESIQPTGSSPRLAASASWPALPRAWRPYLAAGFLALALGSWGVLHRRPAAPMPSFRQMTFRRGTVYTARFTPGATGIVYSAQWDGGPRQLFTTLPGTLDTVDLQRGKVDVHGLLDAGGILAITRPGGGFSAGTLARVPMGPGPAKELLEGVAWADHQAGCLDDAIIRDVDGRARLEFPIGRPLVDSSGRLAYPRISPTGDRVAFLEFQDPDTDTGCVVVVDRKGARTQVTGVWKSLEGLGWRNDHELWFCASQDGNALWLHAADLKGHLRLLLRVPGRLVLHDLAPDGKVLAERNSYRAFILGLAPGESQPRDLSWLDYSELSQISRDGTQVLFTESGDGGGRNGIVYLRPTRGGPPLRLGEGTALCLSDDGRQALILPPAADHHLERVPVGPGTPVAVPPGSLAVFSWGRFLPGEREAILWASAPGSARRLYRMTLATGASAPLGPPGFAPASCGLSPDGRRLLGTLAGQVAILPLDGGLPEAQPRVPAGLRPVGWGPDPKSLILLQPRPPATLIRYHMESGAATPLQVLAAPDSAGVLGTPTVSLAADGRALVFQGYRLLSDLYIIENIE